MRVRHRRQINDLVGHKSRPQKKSAFYGALFLAAKSGLILTFKCFADKTEQFARIGGRLVLFTLFLCAAN